MNPRIEKLKAERDKTAKRIVALQSKLKNLDEQILKLENTDIIGIVRETGLSIDQLAEFMELLDNKPTAPLPDKFIAEGTENEE